MASSQADSEWLSFLNGEDSINVCISDWKSARTETIRVMRTLADKMFEHGKNSKIASSVGNGVSTVAGVASAICVFAMPVTLGLSGIAGGVLAGVSIAGAATSIGAKVVNTILEKDLKKDIQKVVNRDNKLKERLQEKLKQMEELRKRHEARLRHVKNVKTVLDSTGGLCSAATNVAKEGAKVIEKAKDANGVAQIGKVVINNADEAIEVMTKISRTARFAGAVITFVALPLDIFFFVTDVIDLAKGDVSKAGTAIKKFANELEEELREFLRCVPGA